MSITPHVPVAIPVKAHVRKYLTRQFGSAHKVSKNNLLGLLVLHALEKTYEKPEKNIDHHYQYTLLVPAGYVARVGATLPRNTQQHLGECCTHIFNMAMFAELDSKAWAGEKVLPALRNFLTMFGITEDDMKVESLYKSYQRHCERKENNYPVTE